MWAAELVQGGGRISSRPREREIWFTVSLQPELGLIFSALSHSEKAVPTLKMIGVHSTRAYPVLDLCWPGELARALWGGSPPPFTLTFYCYKELTAMLLSGLGIHLGTESHPF